MRNILAAAAIALTIVQPVYADHWFIGISKILGRTLEDRPRSCLVAADGSRLVGREREKFINDCVEAAKVKAARMKFCDKDAGTQGLRGDARRQFMRGCLNG